MKEASKVLNLTHSQVMIADAVATEIVKRFTTVSTVKRFNHLLHRVANDTLTDYFAGKLEHRP